MHLGPRRARGCLLSLRDLHALEDAAPALLEKKDRVGVVALGDDGRVLLVPARGHHVSDATQVLVGPVREDEDALHKLRALTQLRLMQLLQRLLVCLLLDLEEVRLHRCHHAGLADAIAHQCELPKGVAVLEYADAGAQFAEVVVVVVWTIIGLLRPELD